MSQFKSWFQKAVTTILDPDRESRVGTLVNVIHHGIQVQGQQFAVSRAISGLQYSTQDLDEAKRRVYRGALERGWKDGVLTAGEQKTAQWLATRLELPLAETRNLDFEKARTQFGLALAQAMQDGILDQSKGSQQSLSVSSSTR